MRKARSENTQPSARYFDAASGYGGRGRSSGFAQSNRRTPQKETLEQQMEKLEEAVNDPKKGLNLIQMQPGERTSKSCW